MRTSWTCCLTLMILLLAANAAVALDAAGFIAAAPGIDEFAGEDIVVLYHAETVEVNPDGRLTHRVHTLQRLQTQWAMRRHSDVRVAWDSERQDLEVVTARTFMRDGTVVPTPDNGFNEVTPGAVSRAAVFLNWREMVISHVGTEPGCVVELEYVLHDRAANALPQSGVMWFGSEHPVLESRFTASGVQMQPMHADEAEFIEADQTWIVRDLPAFRNEGPASHRERFVPHLIWSRFAGLQGLEVSLRRNHEATAVVGTGLEAWLAETREDPAILTDADLIQSIAALVHDQTAVVHLPGGPWAAAPRPAEDVFATAIGTDWERAILAMTLLSAAGWQPEIGVFGPTTIVDRQPVVSQRFTHLRVVIRVGDENWWIAPDRADAWTGSCDLAGWTGLFLAAAGGHRLYTVPVKAGDCRWSAHLSPDPDGGWTATGDLVLRGPYRPSGLEARDLADQLAGRLLPDGEVSNVDIREDSPQVLSLRLTVTAASIGEPESSLLIRELPWPTTGVLAHLPAGFHPERPTRQSPLWVTTPGTEHVTLKIDLPATWHFDTPPASERSETAPATTFTQSTTITNQTLTLTRTLTIDQATLSPTDYPSFRSVITAATTATRSPLVLITD